MADAVVVLSVLALIVVAAMPACAVAPPSADACVATHNIAIAQNAAPSQRRRSKFAKA